MGTGEEHPALVTKSTAGHTSGGRPSEEGKGEAVSLMTVNAQRVENSDRRVPGELGSQWWKIWTEGVL